jgi:hypothetical protein
MHGGDGKCKQNFIQKKLKGRNQLGDLPAKGRIILK